MKTTVEQIMLKFPRLAIMTFLGNHTRDNQEAVVHSLKQLLKAAEAGQVENPMAYLEATMKIENGKHNARDHDRESQEHKRPIGKTGMATIGEIFRKAGV